MNDELRNDTKIAKYNGVLKTIGIVITAVAVALGAVWGLGINKYEEPTLAEKKADLINVLSDGQFDFGMLLAELKQTDLSTLGEYVRPVQISAARYLSEQEVLDLYNANIQRFLDQITATYGEDVPESVNVPELAKTVEDLPDQIKDAFDADGNYRVPILATAVNSVLIGDQVAIPSSVFQAVFNAPAEAGGSIQVDIKLLADPSVEDQWKEEVLFSGSALDLVTNSIRIHPSQGLALIARPADRVLVEPDENAVDVAVLEDIQTTNTVVYGNSVSTQKASVAQVVADRNLFVIKGAFTARDLGAPVFVLQDGEPVWAGIIVGLSDGMTAIVVSSEAALALTVTK